MSLGKRLAKLRAGKNLTQNAAAKLIGITRSRLALYETDKRDLDTDTLKQIAVFYGVSVDELLGNDQKITLDINANTEAKKIVEEIQSNPKYLELHRLVKSLPDDKVKEVLNFAKYTTLQGGDRKPDDEDDF